MKNEIVSQKQSIMYLEKEVGMLRFEKEEMDVNGK